MQTPRNGRPDTTAHAHWLLDPESRSRGHARAEGADTGEHDCAGVSDEAGIGREPGVGALAGERLVGGVEIADAVVADGDQRGRAHPDHLKGRPSSTGHHRRRRPEPRRADNERAP